MGHQISMEERKSGVKSNIFLERVVRPIAFDFLLLTSRADGEMADAPDLGSGGETLGGSSPLPPTIFSRGEHVVRLAKTRSWRPTPWGRFFYWPGKSKQV